MPRCRYVAALPLPAKPLQATPRVLGTLALIAWSLDYLNIDLDRLPGMLGRMGESLGRRYFPPNVGHILNADYLQSVIETLQMSYLATVLGIVAAIPLAWFASHNMTPSRRSAYPAGAALHHGVPLGARDDLDDPAGRACWASACCRARSR